MRLLTKVTYLVKQGKGIFFKNAQNQSKNSSPSMPEDTETAENTHHKHPTQNKDNGTSENTSKSPLFAKRLKDQGSNPVKKSLFSIKTSFQKQNQRGSDQPIIKYNQEEGRQGCDITKILKVTHLPMDLFNLHKQKAKFFTPENYGHLFAKLSFACRNIESLIKYQTDSSKQPHPLLNHPELTISNTSTLFYSREQMIAHQEWRLLILTIFDKLRAISDISQFNKYLSTSLTLRRNFNYVPVQIYSQLIIRNSQSDFGQLTNIHISQILQLIRHKNRTKVYKDDEVAPQSVQNVSIDILIKNLAQSVLSNPSQYTKEDFLNVFIIISKKSKKMGIITQENLSQSQTTAIKYLKQLSMENVFTYMQVYALLHKNVNKKHLETLKQHLQKACFFESRHQCFMTMLPKLKQRKLFLKNAKEENLVESYVQLYAEKLAENIAKVLSGKIHLLKPIEIIDFVDFCFDNEIKETDVLTAISIKFAQLINKCTLENLAKSLFKLHLLGFHSDKLRQSVCLEFASRYYKQLKIYKSQKLFSPPPGSTLQADSTWNLRQIHLQQCLIMLVWTSLEQICKQPANRDKLAPLLKLVPSTLQCIDPLMIQLCDNINKKASLVPGFPLIKSKFTSNTFIEGRLDQFYRHSFYKSEVQLLMWEQAQLTGKFIANYNIEANKYLAQRWSSTSLYNCEDYLAFCLRFSNGKSSEACFYDKKISLPNQFVKKRSHIINNSLLNSKDQSRTSNNQ